MSLPARRNMTNTPISAISHLSDQCRPLPIKYVPIFTFQSEGKLYGTATCARSKISVSSRNVSWTVGTRVRCPEVFAFAFEKTPRSHDRTSSGNCRTIVDLALRIAHLIDGGT